MKKKPKLLVILNRLVIGGQALDTVPVLHSLKNEFEILVLYGSPEKDEAEPQLLFNQFQQLNTRQIKWFKRSLNPFFDLIAFFQIFNTIRKFKPGIVHTHGLKSGILGRLAAYMAGTKCIFHSYHGHHFHSYFNGFLSQVIVFVERLMAKITTKLIAISPVQQNEFVHIYKIAPAKKITVIRLGIDDAVFGPANGHKRQAFRQRYALQQNTIAIGIIGRVVPVKNHPLFAEIAANVLADKNNSPNTVFFVIGDGAEKPNIEAWLTRAGIPWCNNSNFNPAARVIFTSWVQEVAEAVYGMDIVVLTSHNEGTPLSLIEAQYCGKPVVATNVGGVKDTFINEETGFLVPAHDAGAFTNKLMLLIKDDNLRATMGIKAAAFATKNFSKTKEIDSFRQLYLSCSK